MYVNSWVKRLFDFSVSLLLLPFTVPLLLALSFVVLITSGWPVIFAQERIGLGGRPFRIYKLRTMRRGAEESFSDIYPPTEHDSPFRKDKLDPRVTSFGRFLRYSYLDELPQIFNVLGGSMSLVGPRPHIPEDVSCYSDYNRKRLSMKPGLTSSWYVVPHDKTLDVWTKLDMDYRENASLSLDVSIILRTLAILASRTLRYLL
ncbi:MAG: sugar transferase [Candidatus Altiarchaeota archaeon]